MSNNVKVPEGWKRVKLGEIAQRLNKIAPKMSKPYLEIGDINIISKSYELKDKESPNHCLVAYHNNLVISKVRPTRGAIAKIKEPKIFVSPALLVCEYDNPIFLFYSLSRDNFFNYLGKLETGTTYPSVNDVDILSYEILVPQNSNEQQKIAEILETVDKAIEKTDKIIEKYKRIKQGLMQDLLTKGIDKNGKIRSEETHKFKDSPIGRIPEEWEVVRLGEVSEIKGGKRLPKGEELVDEGHPYIRLLDIEGIKINVSKVKFIPEKIKNVISKYIVSKNDVILSIAGTIGLVALIPEELDGANLTENAVKIIDLVNLDKNFLVYALSSHLIQSQIKKLIGVVAQPKLALYRISTIFIPLPPLPEQQRIAEILSQIDNTIEKEEAYKQKLERIKKGLMEDLLTGRVRVNKLLSEEGKCMLNLTKSTM